MKKEIFREYDIRGIVGQDFDLAEAEIIGQGYGTYLKQKGGTKAVVARDCRLTSDSIRDGLIKGMVKSGLEVVDVGVCPAPVFYFALRHLNMHGGLMITASHNPPE